MKTLIKNYRGDQFEIEVYFFHKFRSYGHWHIIAEVDFLKEKKQFKYLTTDSEFIDKIAELKSDSWDDVQEHYYEFCFENLKEQIIEWCEDVTEENENEKDDDED